MSSTKTTELRDELARRLWDAATAYEGFQGFPYAEQPEELQKTYLKQADEVIRCMEYARQQALEHIAGGRHDAPRWAHEVHTAVSEMPLTLPPPDWQP